MNSFRGFIRGFCWRVPILPTDLVIAVQALSGSTDNFLKILRIFLDLQQLMETIENCFRFRELFGTPRPIYGEFSETSESCLTLPRTVWDFRELFKTTETCLRFENYLELRDLFLENFLRLLTAVWYFRELFETSENCLKLPGTVWHFRELFDTSENCLALPRTV